ncbi:MAG TPA: XrtN system VIT domain-containing protein, partial [Chryseolinea sp.]|nr:XrtN system VIT domain-containing protein [Chryseolinea sp.]
MELELIDYPASILQRKTQQKKALSPLDVWGYLMLGASFLTYAVCEYIGVKQNLFMIFFLHHFLSVAYTVVLLSNGVYGIRRSWLRENIDRTIIALNLYLISAYALNREMQVFSTAVDWFCIYILISSCSLLSFRYFTRLPSWINKLQLLTLGSATLLYLYLAIYVADFYALGSVGIIAIGIGTHVFVPIALFTACISICILYLGKQAYYWVSAGIAIPVCAVILFTVEWTSRASEIEAFANKSSLYRSELPVWINVAQRLKNDWISERLLKSDLVYTTARRKLRNWEFLPSNASWDDIKKHDPLVFIASLRADLSLSAEDRTKILKTISSKRHKANERLWSGDDLATSYIVSDIDIYTDLRLAYTEKYINVRNNNERAWWGNTQ